MKKRLFSDLLCVILCVALLLSCMPFTAFAESADAAVQMVEGEVTVGFFPAGTACTSSDPSVAWVDENGSLNAMKTGTATVSDGVTDYTVTVGDYTDGSEVVGSLKLLARYSDSMQFYDGHVYLLFTSYQDGVNVTVPDLYAAYEIDDRYYADIREDISKGSNHTGNDADEYFSENREINSVTLDRGEIVTIGMYRDFDLSVNQAVLGTIQNSSMWKELTVAGKAAIITALFDYLNKGKIDSDEALERIKAVLDEEGLDYNTLIDGVVDGGVCFNRELYNQKLEWDQYENVTYEMDITRNQLDTMMLYLSGNNGKFSILKNSCATVALRAWNAAVGMRNGEKSSYYLTAEAEGIYSVIDAPKGVRDNIVKRLPGCYLNNAQGVAEPDAGYQDDTGWVYVSAPEKVAPLTCVYQDGFLIDEEGSKMSALINAAKGEQRLSYHKDAQEVGVSVKHETNGDYTTISGVDFTVNGTTVSLTGDNIPEEGVRFKVPCAAPAQNEYYRILGENGEELSGYYREGYLFIHTQTLPITYRLASAEYEDEPAGIGVHVNGAENSDITTEVYYKNGDEKIVIEESAFLDPGAKVFIKSNIPQDDTAHILSRIEFGEENVMDGDHYDADENAFFVTVTDTFTYLNIYYKKAAVSLKGENILQIKVGDTVDVKDHAALKVRYSDEELTNIVWETVYDPYDGAVAVDGGTLTGNKQGVVLMKACAAENPNVCVVLTVEVYENFDAMCAVTMDDKANQDYQVCYTADDVGQIFTVPFSGYRVNQGAVMTIKPVQESSKALRSVKFNGKEVKAGEAYTVEADTEVEVTFADAVINGMPKSVKLVSKDETYQLEAKVKYTGLLQFLPVYDRSVTYRSSDPLVAVDDNGRISVVGDIPESGCVVYVTAYAGSSNDKVSAVCKVVVGDYQGDRIVGSLTISARPMTMEEMVAHSMVTFTAYEPVSLDVSYSSYSKPNQKFYDLMQDYADHPENYTSDPALYNGNELGLENRESYFDVYVDDAFSAPQPIELNAGESITMSNYGDENPEIFYLLKTLENSTLSAFSPQTKELVSQIRKYLDGEDFEADAAFDNLIAALTQAYAIASMTGYNPADGLTKGGLMINKEAYVQFVRERVQSANNYYTVDITADELAMLKAYLADPQNNYYSMFHKSCATSSVDIWNTTLSDRPELAINGNFTGLADDPVSIYYEVGALRYKSGLDGKGGDDYYPRIVVREPSEKPVDPSESPLLGDVNGDGAVTILDTTFLQRKLTDIPIPFVFNDKVADTDGNGSVSIIDATYIQSWLANLKTNDKIGKPIA